MVKLLPPHHHNLPPSPVLTNTATFKLILTDPPPLHMFDYKLPYLFKRPDSSKRFMTSVMQ
jgi:hypothetical protein